jgi:hypothetical protein
LTIVAPTDSLATTFSSAATGQMNTFGGTSCANPNMAGIASLIWSANPYLTGTQVRSIVQQTAMDLGAAGRDNTFGYGLVNADLAVRRARAMFLNQPLANFTGPIWPIYQALDVEFKALSQVTAPSAPPVEKTLSAPPIAGLASHSTDQQQHMSQDLEIVRPEEKHLVQECELPLSVQALDLAFMSFAARDAADAAGNEATLELFAV